MSLRNKYIYFKLDRLSNKGLMLVPSVWFIRAYGAYWRNEKQNIDCQVGVLCFGFLRWAIVIGLKSKHSELNTLD